MSNTTVVTRNGGIGFVGLLTILFIALKLTGVIDWAWLWVLAPIWISVGLWLVAAIVGLLVVGIGLFFVWRSERKPRKGISNGGIRGTSNGRGR